jgi:beta-galactosidase
MKLAKLLNAALLTAALSTAVATPANGQINYQNTQRLEKGWQFVRGDAGNVWETVRPAPAGSPESVPLWSEVSLPHCFNAFDAVDPDVNYYQGPGWYRTRLRIDNPYEGGRTLLHFEGAGQRSEVWVYTTKVGEHTGGYDEWTVDITDAVAGFLASNNAKRFDGMVPVSIRCDNSRDTETIPSDMSDFNLYGGIYRYLNLVYVPRTSIGALHVDASVDPNGRQGRIVVAAEIDNPVDGELEMRIVDPTGRVVHRSNRSGSLATKIEMPAVALKKPLLWSPDSPSLYTVELTITSPAGTTTCRDRFGFRHFEFVEHGPFMLNGQRLLLRGTHRHEDHAGVGAAMDETTIVREMEMMKQMGVNFIRLGHYQQSRIVLDACDSLGILVWEEIPWCRGGVGGPQYRAQAQRMLRNMITQHRNHPSIILWGLGNENDWPGDFPTFDRDEIRDFMTRLHNLSHSIDPTRLTCIRRCDFCKDIVDVYSPSIWAGWYGGVYTDYKNTSQREMRGVKHFLHVEWGGDNHAQRHAEDPYKGLDWIVPGGNDERAGDASFHGGRARASRDGDWSESYICDLIDWHLKEQETMPRLTGAAYWPFKDFSTPLRPENPVPYVNQKGVTERDLTPKEAYYVFQSYWTRQPMVRIYGHTWPVRWGDEGETKTVKVYSNCPEVELFLNGTSLGRRKRNSADFPAAGLRWETPFRPGANTMRAVGYARDGKRVDDGVDFEYETRKWGPEAAIELSSTDNGDGTAWVDVRLTDAAGVPCLDSRSYIEFSAAGDGQLIHNMGTSTGSHRVQAFNGRGRIKVDKRGGETVVAVRSGQLKTAFITITR